MRYQLTTKLVFSQSASSVPRLLAELSALPSKKPTLTEIIVGHNQNDLTVSIEATGSGLAVDTLKKVLRQVPYDELAEPAVLTSTDENGECTHVAFGRTEGECDTVVALAYLDDMDQRALDVGNKALIQALANARRYLEEEARKAVMMSHYMANTARASEE